MDGFLGKLKALTNNSDLSVAVGLLLILSVMIVPIPPMLLDLLLALTLSLAIMILLVSVYSKKPLDFSTFPSVLLVMTLFRLSLNVASTRNILLRGPSDRRPLPERLFDPLVSLLLKETMLSGLLSLSFS